MLKFIALLLVCLLACSSPEQPTVTVHHAILLTGASNMRGTDAAAPPAGIPIDVSVLPYWLSQVGGTPDAEAFHDLDIHPDGDWGAELTMGLGLVDLGLDASIIKIVRGSSSLDQWLPGGPYYADFIAELTEAKAAHDVLAAGLDVRWHWFDQRGETEIRAVTIDSAVNFEGRYEDLRDEIATVLGTMPVIHCVLTSSATEGANVATNLPYLRASQIAVADHTVNIDDLAMLVDNVHLTHGSQEILGTRELASMGAFRQRHLGFPRKAWANP
jgi:hypothetical protein